MDTREERGQQSTLLDSILNADQLCQRSPMSRMWSASARADRTARDENAKRRHDDRVPVHQSQERRPIRYDGAPDAIGGEFCLMQS